MSQIEWLTEISDKIYKEHSNITRTGQCDSEMRLPDEVIVGIYYE